MAFKLMPCTCTASALAVFIRRIAHIDIALESRLGSNIRRLSTSRRNLSTSYLPQSQGTSHQQADKAPSYGTADRGDPIPFDRTRPNGRTHSSRPGWRSLQLSLLDNLEPRKWAMGDLEMKNSILARDSLPHNAVFKLNTNFNSDTSSFSEISHQYEEGPGFIELNQGTIDALAVKSAEVKAHTKSYASKPTWEARPNHLPNSTKGFKLHYGSPPVAPASKAKEVKMPDFKTSRNQVPASEASDRRRYLVAEQEPWQIQKAALKEKFKEGWNPRKKLSPDALAGIRAIHAQFPEQYTTSVLAEKFEVSPEAIRRILKSRWTPKEEEVLDRQRRWFIRGQKIWSRYSELGLKPPAHWRELGIGKKGKYSSGRRQRKSVDTDLTTQSANYAVQTSDKILSTPASMAERIL